MILKLCKICNKEYYSSDSKNSNVCSLECRKLYSNSYGKFGLPQRNEENLLLCYNCLEYKKDEEFWNHKNKHIPESRNGKNTTCGSCNKYKNNLLRDEKKETLDGILKNRLNIAKYSSKKRNIYFDNELDIKYLKNIYDEQDGKCALSGEILEFGKWDNKTLSIDRIDSNLGYSKGNIQLVCWIINHMKVNLEQNEFINWCNKISEKQLISI